MWTQGWHPGSAGTLCPSSRCGGSDENPARPGAPRPEPSRAFLPGAAAWTAGLGDKPGGLPGTGLADEHQARQMCPWGPPRGLWTPWGCEWDLPWPQGVATV